MRRQSRRLPREHTRTRQHDGIGIHGLLVRPRCKLAASQLLNFSKVVGTFGTATAGVLFDRSTQLLTLCMWGGWVCRRGLINVNYIGGVQLPAITIKTETFLEVDPDGFFFFFFLAVPFCTRAASSSKAATS